MPTQAAGTYFLAGVTTEYAVVAIDSRESRTGVISSATNDSYCKIRPLSNRAIFFATGVTAAWTRTGVTIFDARDVAQRAFENFVGDNYRDLANRWARQMQNFYFGHADSFAPLANEITAQGFFIGTNSLNKISASTATYLEDLIYSKASPIAANK
jgi:hypothetical protein